MKINHLLFAIGYLLIGSCWSCQQTTKEIRFMTYNIRNCRGMDDSTNYSRIAQIIRNENPDVIALQELDSVTKRSKKIDVLNELVRQTGLSGIYSAAIDYEGGKYGIGILSKEKPQKIYRKTLPGSEEKRTMLIAEFKHYVFINMHLSLTEQDRDAVPGGKPDQRARPGLHRLGAEQPGAGGQPGTDAQARGGHSLPGL